jgi:hypothetical protein
MTQGNKIQGREDASKTIRLQGNGPSKVFIEVKTGLPANELGTQLLFRPARMVTSIQRETK